MIRDQLSRIVAERAADDPHLHYLDGRELYGEADFAELPLPDQLHPDAATHRRIGERFAASVFGEAGVRRRVLGFAVASLDRRPSLRRCRGR